MKAISKAMVLTVLMVMLTACAHRETARQEGGQRPVSTVYLWDVDGHTDIALLRGLKAEAAQYLKSKGLAVSSDPDATDAYLKITVLDAGKDSDAKRAFIKARLYIISASDGGMIFDKTYEARAMGEDYPYAGFVKGALGGFF